MKRYSLLTICFFIIFIIHGIITIVLYNKQPDLRIVPNELFITMQFTDKQFGGKSTIESLQKAGDGIVCKYTLRPGAAPYIAVILHKDNLFSIEEYDLVVLDVELPIINYVTLGLGMNVPGYTTLKDEQTFLRLEYELPVKPGKKQYSIPITNFRIPVDWYLRNKSVPFSHIENIDYSQAVFFMVAVSHETTMDFSSAFKIKGVRLCPDRTGMLLLSATVFFIYSLFIFLYKLLLKRSARLFNKYRNTPVPQETIQLNDDLENNAKKVITFLGKYYHDTGISVEMVSSECSVPAYRISQILRDLFDLSFPQYVTSIRLAEAKRLLKETDKKVVEIARMVGYIYPNNFNRVFKMSEGISPVEFRDKYKV